MSKFVHILLHVVAIVAQVGTVAGGVVPGPWQPVVVGVVSTLQAILAVTQHGKLVQ